MDLLSLDHRYLWSTRFVVARLRRDELSEAAVFRYFLAVMAFEKPWPGPRPWHGLQSQPRRC